MSQIARVLAVGGSDSGGGAGIQADIKTLSALGVYAATAVTAVTVQDTVAVHAVHAVPPRLIAGQIRAVLADIGACAVKTGMIGDVPAFEAVLEALGEWPEIPRVVDPVMWAKGGAALMAGDAMDGLRALIRGAALVTPNAPEAEALTGRAVNTLDDQRAAADLLLEAGAGAVLLKGGHIAGDRVIDLLATPRGETMLEGPRIESRHTHGTGCTLACACAAGLALGLSLQEAVARAWAFTGEAIRNAPSLGAGAGPLGHVALQRRR